jgi:hypothetical protein
MAAPLLTKVEPSVEKGRSDPAVKMTGGAEMPPRAPVKVWTLSPEAAAAEVAEAAAEQTVATLGAAAEVATTAATLEAAAGMVIITVTVAGAGQEPPATLAGVVATAAAGEAGALEATETPATAALISAGVASTTSRFWVKMQPTGSFWVSQELPLEVGSPIWRVC